MNSIIVYIGSFDPPHRGHIECATMALEKFRSARQVVFLPNNSRQGKPKRSSLALRARWLSFYMPIFNHSDWIRTEYPLICDTRECDYVVDILRDRGFNIVGLVGSDLCKPPKLIAQDWIVFERAAFPIQEALKYLDGKRVHVVPSCETKWQHLSSSLIRAAAENNDFIASNAIHNSIVPYFEKKFRGSSLSLTTIDHCLSNVDQLNTFQIRYISKELANHCAENLQKLEKSIFAKFFEFPSIVYQQENAIDFSLVDGQTLFEILTCFIKEEINEKNLTETLTRVFVLLQRAYFSKEIVFPQVFHCDPSAKNIIFEAPTKFTLVDFENCKILSDKTQVKRYYDRFASSFEFYLTLHGYERDRCVLTLIKDCEKIAWLENIKLIDQPMSDR